MEWLGTVRLVAFSVIHKATGSLVTSYSQNATGRNTPRNCSPIHSFRDIFPVGWWNDRIVPVKPKEELGTMRLTDLWIMLFVNYTIKGAQWGRVFFLKLVFFSKKRGYRTRVATAKGSLPHKESCTHHCSQWVNLDMYSCNWFTIISILEKYVVEDDILFTNHLVGTWEILVEVMEVLSICIERIWLKLAVTSSKWFLPAVAHDK